MSMASEVLKAFWYGRERAAQRHLRNWGDIFAPYVIRAFAGKPARNSRRVGSRYMVVGSVLHKLREGDIVWGCGLLSPRNYSAEIVQQATFHAVRGPLTRSLLRGAGVAVPRVYGDPALLAPYLFPVKNPQVTHRVGLVPHYNDLEAVQHLASDEVKVIDVTGGLAKVIREVCSCEGIVASSLHGLILGDCYAQKSAWMTVRGGIRLAGGPFKFTDYFSSTGRPALPSPVEDWPKVQWSPKMQYDPQPLIDACPFNLLGVKSAADLRQRWL